MSACFGVIVRFRIDQRCVCVTFFRSGALRGRLSRHVCRFSIDPLRVLCWGFRRVYTLLALREVTIFSGG